MSIATEITRLQTAKANIKTSLENKGATVPSTTKLDGYSTIIDSLPNATKYGMSADNILGNVDSNGDIQQPTQLFDLVLSGVEKIQINDIFHYKFAYNPTVKSVTFPDLIYVGAAYGGQNICTNMFLSCSNLESASFPELVGTNGNFPINNGFREMFVNCSKLKTLNMPKLKKLYQSTYSLYSICRGCSQLISFNLDSLEEIYSNMMQSSFQKCTSLTSASFPKLTRVLTEGMYSTFQECSSLTSISFPLLSDAAWSRAFYNCFTQCTSLTSINFPALSDIQNSQVFMYCFNSCTSLTSVSFPALTSQSFGSYTNQFQNMLANTSSCTVHFPSNLQSVIGSWSDVTNGFGGTNTTVLFDLPVTE